MNLVVMGNDVRTIEGAAQIMLEEDPSLCMLRVSTDLMAHSPSIQGEDKGPEISMFGNIT